MPEMYATIAGLRPRLGMVIPVWYPPSDPDEKVRSLLTLTLADSELFMPPEQIVLVVDGDRRIVAAAEAACEAIGEPGRRPHLIVEDSNRGKEYAVTTGMRWLLSERPSADLLAVRDADADHFINDLPNLARAAAYVTEATNNPRAIIIGRRESLHRPMGWLRGELEGLQNRVLLDALRFRLAQEGRALDLRFCAPDGVPDFNSGYKVYTRAAAEEIFRDPGAEMRCLGPEEFWRCGAETISIVHGVLAGANLGEVRRLTFDGQPTTTFGAGSEARVRWYSGVIAWILCRLEIPLPAARSILDQQVAVSAMRTLDEAARELQAVRDSALERLSRYYGEPVAQNGPTLPLPFL